MRRGSQRLLTSVLLSEQLRQVATAAKTGTVAPAIDSYSSPPPSAPTDPMTGGTATSGATGGADNPEAVKDPILAATRRLRSALEAWEEVEKAKVMNAALKERQALQKQQQAVLVGAEGGNRDTASTSTPPQGSVPVVEPAPAATSASTGRADTVAASATPSTVNWIRNKQPKFWDIVYRSPTVTAAALAEPSSAPANAAPPTAAAALPPTGETPPPPPPSADGTTTASTSFIHSPAVLAQQPPEGQAQRRPQATPLRPFRSRYKRNVAQGVADLLNSDPALGPALLGSLSAESRRLLLVMGTASEYFGENYMDLVEQVKKADRDQDARISAKDYDEWAQTSYRDRDGGRSHREPSAQSTDSSEGAGVASSGAQDEANNAGAPEAALLTSTPTTATASTNASRIVKAMQKDPGAISPSPSTSAVRACGDNSIPDLLKDLRVQRDGDGGGDPCGDGSALDNLLCALGITPKKEERASVEASQNASHIPWKTWIRLMLAAAAPFMAFGMLDNATLVLAGDAIDRYVSESFGLSEMAAAGLGGVVSGVAGIQVHGLAERWTRAAPPVLSIAQQKNSWYSRATRCGNSLGMAVGLVLGMLPLLFIGASGRRTEEEEEENDRFRKEADRSRQRRVRETMQRETNFRHVLEKEEAKAWKVLVNTKY